MSWTMRLPMLTHYRPPSKRTYNIVVCTSLTLQLLCIYNICKFAITELSQSLQIHNLCEFTIFMISYLSHNKYLEIHYFYKFVICSAPFSTYDADHSDIKADANNIHLCEGTLTRRYKVGTNFSREPSSPHTKYANIDIHNTRRFFLTHLCDITPFVDLV